MRFAILGPLEVNSVDGPVHVAGLRQRKILGALLLSANAPVSIDRLIDVLWGEAPPRTAREQIQNCTGKLASAISSRSARVIRGNGVYMLRVNEENVDAIAFRCAFSRVQEMAAAGDRKDASIVLRAALDLWRGDVLADVLTDGMRAEATQLEELRVSMIEQYAESAIRTSEPHLAISELCSAVVRQPYNERLCALLMRALFQTGRSAEALQLFTEMCDRLRNELGVEPGAELVRSHRLIAGPAGSIAAAGRPGLVGRRSRPSATRPDAEAVLLVNEALRLLADAAALIGAPEQASRCQSCGSGGIRRSVA